MTEDAFEKSLRKKMDWLSRLPPPVPANITACGAPCPWCGFTNRTITFGRANPCEDCGRPFYFGIPDWADGPEYFTWVMPRWQERDLLESHPDLFPKWEPNDRLKEINFRLVQDKTEAGNA